MCTLCITRDHPARQVYQKPWHGKAEHVNKHSGATFIQAVPLEHKRRGDDISAQSHGHGNVYRQDTWSVSPWSSTLPRRLTVLSGHITNSCRVSRNTCNVEGKKTKHTVTASVNTVWAVGRHKYTSENVFKKLKKIVKKNNKIKCNKSEWFLFAGKAANRVPQTQVGNSQIKSSLLMSLLFLDSIWCWFSISISWVRLTEGVR